MNAIDMKDMLGMEDDDLIDAYRDYLDSLGEVHIGNLTYSASWTLKNVDPVAFRCGFNDWLDSLENEEFPGSRWQCERCGERFSDEEEAQECCTNDE